MKREIVLEVVTQYEIDCPVCQKYTQTSKARVGENIDCEECGTEFFVAHTETYID